MNHTYDRAPIRIPSLVVLPAAVFVVGLVGVADFLTGSEISFSIFYVAPIALAAWYGGRLVGIVTAGLACVAWLAADLLSVVEISHVLIPFWNAAVRLSFFATIAVMVSEIHRRLDYAKRLARIDPLTGALNSIAFHELAESELTRARRYGRPFTLAYMDVDNFKQINDQHGHQSGDRALAEIVDAIRGELRETDIIARLGGDELAVLLIETDKEETGVITRRLCETVRDRMSRAGWPATLSIGAVTFERPPSSVAEMTHLADELMYTVKRSGKDGFAQQVYPSS